MKKSIGIFLFIIVSWLCSIDIYAQNKGNENNENVEGESDSLRYETDEIIITGTRTKKKIIDIPYSVRRIDQSSYKYSKKEAIDDILGTIPGLFLQSRYGNHDVRISIRGFGSRSNSGIRGVRILLDDIPESEPDGQTRIEALDFQSIGKIEIVKGNSSSLYTNAPGGVINFINDIEFENSFAINFNQFGSFDLRENGVKTGVKTDDYRLLTTYKYHNSKGFREHSNDYWNILNTVVESTPGDNSQLKILGYAAFGMIKLPGSLTLQEFDQDPYQAAQRELDFDYRRVSNKGRLGVRFNTLFGKKLNNEIEVTGYGTIKYFHRTSTTYRIINRYGLGASAKFVNSSKIFNRDNEIAVGTDLLYQTGPVETYQNINGQKGDNLTALTDKTISNTGLFFSNTFNIVKSKLDLLITGRYDRVVFNDVNQLLAVQNDERVFEDFTPKFALNYKFLPNVAAYTSYGYSFDSPAGNELDNFPTSSNPGKLLNPDLQPQKSNNFEVGIKGNVLNFSSKFFNYIFFEAAFFNYVIDDEIVPFEVFGDVYFRNSAQTLRRGVEVGGDILIYEGLQLNLAYTYNNFSYDSYDAETVTIDTTGAIVTQNQSFAGNTVPSVPEQMLSANLSYNHKFTKNITGFVRGSTRFVGSMFVDDANSAEVAAYSIFGGTLGLDMTFDRFNLLLSGGVENIADKVYVGFVNINSSTGRYYEAGAPRNYYGSINLGYKF